MDLSAWQPARDLHTDFERRSVQPPHSVIVFAFAFDSLVWVRHPLRGWELPGGKVEPGETAEEAVKREAWEEAGLTLEHIAWLAEYTIVLPTGVKAVKWVYTADVYDVAARPHDSEILDVWVPRPAIDPATVRQCHTVSPVMKDEMFSCLFPMARQRCLERRM
ncbi:8-oxo-dGTP diphosphatase [Alicyclobacillus sacchari]|uniref:8-oxo-dGTP diphosphatase n=1 Tax=Alicyclobacillus sacchari TaxID=392010 RepID=A0A4R8LPS3_9BACL|nr:NUDIX domain-containing protein [Alicyclobacillus sacchari]TDY49503.1 8-oxo-dGTP diphosphatase [Alicyclobacillus sacchari]